MTCNICQIMLCKSSHYGQFQVSKLRAGKGCPQSALGSSRSSLQDTTDSLTKREVMLLFYRSRAKERKDKGLSHGDPKGEENNLTQEKS